MSGSTRSRRIVTLCACALLTLSAAAGPVAAPQEEAEPAPAEAGLWDEVVKLYEKAKEAGERVPKDVVDWVQEDLQNIGDWEYKVVEMDAADAAAVETRLNELGEDRWDCIWIEERAGRTRFIFKRSSRAYLQHIPLGDLMKLLPGGSATP